VLLYLSHYDKELLGIIFIDHGHNVGLFFSSRVTEVMQ